MLSLKRATIVAVALCSFILFFHHSHLTASAGSKAEDIYTKLLNSSADLKKAERELNEAYKSCMSILNADAQGRLKNNQIKWLGSRTYQLESRAGNLMLETRILELTNERIAQLKSLSASPFPFMLQDSGSPPARTRPGENQGNPPKETLSVSISETGNSTLEVGIPINVSWTLNHDPVQPDKVYDFVVLSMPNTVRLKGDGFQVIPPQQDLPFGMKYNPDKFRVIFPLYLLNHKRVGSFAVRPLVAGRFDIEWSYLALDRKTKKLVFSTGESDCSASFEVLDTQPKIIVQDRMGGDVPKDIRVSHSGAYELRVYEGRFEIYVAATGRLILYKFGTSPEFSPTSRFLTYFSQDGFCVLDILNQEQKTFSKVGWGEWGVAVIAWARGDSFMILGSQMYGVVYLMTPHVDAPKEISCNGPHMMSGLDEGLVFDSETALVCFDQVNYGVRIVSIVNDFDKSAETLGYDDNAVVALFSAYLSQLGLQIPSIPQGRWKIPGGAATTGGDPRLFWDKPPSRELEPSFLERQSQLKQLVDSRTKSVSSARHVGAEVLSSTSRVKYAPTSDAIEAALAERLKEKGFNFPKNIEMQKVDGDGSLKKLPKLPTAIWNDIRNLHLFDHNTFSETIDDRVEIHYWQYPKVAPEATTVVHVDRSDDSYTTHSIISTLLLRNAKGGLINLGDKVDKALAKSEHDRKYYFSGIRRERGSVVPFVSTSNINILMLVLSGCFILDDLKSSIILYDINDNRVVAIIPDVIDSDSLQSLMYSRDGRFILQINKGGRFFIYDVQNSKRIILNGVYLDDEWVIYTDEGFYDATAEGGHLVSWFYPGLQEHFDFNQFESAFKRPELIREILAGGSPNLPSIRPAAPPRVTLVSDATLTETDKKSYTLNASVSAQDSVQTVRVFLNGEPVKEMPVGAKTGQVSAEVPLFYGLNRISSVAYNEKGFSSNLKYVDVVCTNADAPKPDLYVLTVGISQYPKLPKEWQLYYAHTDAKNLAGAFKAQEGKLFGNVYTKTLANQDATPASITEELKALEKAGKKDLVVVMLAGHGIRSKDGTFYFLTPNCDIDAPETGDGALSWGILAQYLEKIQSRVVLLLDACHSGGVITETVVPNDALAQKFFAKGKGGITVFAASKGRQVSMESPDVGGGFGVFTYGIVQALSARAAEADIDGNGFVEWLELVGNVSAFVHNETRGEQTPWLARSEIFGDFPIAIGQRRLVKKMEIPVQPPPPSMEPERPDCERSAEAHLAKQGPIEASVHVQPASPATGKEPSDKGSNIESISQVIRSYYQFVETKKIEQAISCFAASKQPGIKRGMLEAIAKDTESFRIGKIEPVEIGSDRAKLRVDLYHKKHGKPEELWETNAELVSVQGEWKIVSTSGKKIR